MSNTVTCSYYDWTAGAVDVFDGTFTADDLVDNGLFGKYYINPGGTINLSNNDGYVDLRGELHIFGGNFNVWGGSGFDCFMPYFQDAVIEMSGGVLDFKNVGVRVYNCGYTLTENITSGTIRTSGGFRVERADFTPSGGTVEFYGPADGDFFTINGGYAHNVIVNKGVTDNIQGQPPYYGDRGQNGATVTEYPLANTITATNFVDINGNITIQAGTLVAPLSTMTVAGNWTNMAGTAAFDERTGTVEFDGASSKSILTSETFYSLNFNKTFAGWAAMYLTEDITVSGNLHMIDGSVELDNPADLFVTGNLTIDLDAGLNANDPYGPQIFVGGNWTNNNTTYSDIIGFDPGVNSLVTFNGTTNQYLTKAGTEEVFNELVMNKSSGKFRSNDNITCNGNMNITNGIWEDNAASLLHTFYKNFTVQASGAFYSHTTLNTVQFVGSSNSLLTYLSLSGYFYNLTINKSTGQSVTQAGSVQLQWSGLFTVEEGIYNVDGNYLNLQANASIADGGQLSLPAGSLMVIHDLQTLNVNSGGILDITGTSPDPATIRSTNSSSNYTFNVNAGAYVSAEYCEFRNMSAGGINILSGATVDPAHAFTGCSFKDGAAGGTLLTLNNNQTLTVRNAVFPANIWSGASNVSKTLNQGQVYFVDYSGDFSGESYDQDAFFRITWVPTLEANATADPESICTGSTSQLNANPSGGLLPYTFSWSPAGSLSNPLITNPVASPTVTTLYTVTVTDALGTTVSDGITVTVVEYVPVSVTIDVSQNPVPPGTLVLFTATPVYGGPSPAYQWKVNENDVGTGLSTYSYIPSYGDDVRCVLTSNLPCVTGNPASSNTITMIVVPENTTVTGIVPSPLALCFDATDTIKVAGGGSTFVVQNGGSATMIAGMAILYLPGTTVEPGGYMHGYITLTNEYCGSLPPPMVAVVATEEVIPAIDEHMRFIIYPNPTSGTFTLARADGQPAGDLQVELFGLRGESIFRSKVSGEHHYVFDLAEEPVGIYILKVVSGNFAETFKVIKTN